MLIDMEHPEGSAEDMKISREHAGSPLVRNLRRYVYPEWRGVVVSQIQALSESRGVGVPNFGELARELEKKRESAPKNVDRAA